MPSFLDTLEATAPTASGMQGAGGAPTAGGAQIANGVPGAIGMPNAGGFGNTPVAQSAAQPMSGWAQPQADPFQNSTQGTSKKDRPLWGSR